MSQNLTDHEFMAQFHSCALSQFRHRDHLRLAWLVLNRYESPKALSLISEGLKQFATSKGAAGTYHETLTRFWVRIVDHCLKNQSARTDDFERFLAAHPMVLDKGLMYRHWQKETIMSSEARLNRVEPDMIPLP